MPPTRATGGETRPLAASSSPRKKMVLGSSQCVGAGSLLRLFCASGMVWITMVFLFDQCQDGLRRVSKSKM